MFSQKSSTTQARRMVGLVLAVIATIYLSAIVSQAATYTVTNTNNSGPGSLSTAIFNANVSAGFDTIAFNIPGAGIHTINPTSDLVPITGITSIDGTTQPGYSGTPLIELNGALVAGGSVGLRISNGGCGIKGLIINRFYHGIVLENGALNIITGNYIGTNAFGTTALGVLHVGIEITNSSSNTIGGVTDATRNVISGSTGSGILITGNSNGNMIRGNRIGTNAAGTASLPNREGIVIFDADNNIIGGVTVGERNLISGNDEYGIRTGSGSDGNSIAGNYIGTNAAGTVALPNTRGGIFLASSSNNTIGGSVAGTRNLISGNGYNGIYIRSESGPATSNIVKNNYIGTDVTGTLDLGNGGSGIEIDDSDNNIIGGPLVGNFISGNEGEGVFIRGSSGNQVQGNRIGTGNMNAQLPNAFSGILLDNGAANNRIGGTAGLEGNLIYFNLENGVRLSPSCVNNEILGNDIYLNQGIEIELANPNSPLGYDGTTANDPGDADSGANNLQNFPLLSSVSLGGGNTTFTGTLNSKPNASYRIEFFDNFSCNTARGSGIVGVIPSLVTNVGGNANFSVTIPTINTSVGQFITATATDSSGSTSEISPCTLVTSPGPGSFVLNFTTKTVAENVVFQDVIIQRTDGTTGAVSVNFAATNGTATSPGDYTGPSTTYNFAPGETSKTVPITVINDTLDETDETVNLALSGPTGGATLGNPSAAVLTITDNDPAPSVSIADVSLAEGNSGLTNFNFNVTMSAASGQTVTVNYATIAGGTATLGNDYQPTSGTLTFAPGETSKPLTVLVNGDTQDEPNKTFIVELSSQTNATLAKALGSGTILNDDSPVAPTVQFSAANYNAQESDNIVTITVTRTGDVSQPAMVDYATTNLTATERTDYTTALGTLRFGAGEASKTFDVLLTNDAYFEADEQAQLTLSNPTGNLSLGLLGTATLTIKSEVQEPATNPADDAQSFVRQHYHDFLNREPDNAGLQFWTNQITQCGANAACLDTKRQDVSAAFFLSIEFQETGFLVARFNLASYAQMPRYRGFLRDTQEIGRGVIVGQGPWQQQLEANKQAFADRWVQRTDFVAVYGAMTDAQYVDALFAKAGAQPSPSERNALITGLQTQGETRATVLREVAEHGGVVAATYSPSFVLMQYIGYLRRNPDDLPDSNMDGYNFWLQKLNAFGGDFRKSEMVKSFIVSTEYRSHFGQP